MEKAIVWRKRAADKFLNIIDYLFEEWSAKEANEFIDRVELQVQLLSKFPHLGQQSSRKPPLRKFLLSKHNLLIYRIKGNRLILLNIYDTRQEDINF